ncbi:MAG TPA: MASE2 domain-containing protein, partial [Methylomirabilota bacterium]|nr:MASE2 domain-containing protein [Methylomirabilota bacterium]
MTETPRKIHPLVYIDYRIRVVGHLIAAVILASIFYERGAGASVWSAMVAFSVLWPHLAFFNAKHGRNTKNAELTNLLGDAFANGCWIGLVHFSLWPSVNLATAVSVAFLAIAGIRFWLTAILAMVAGAAVTGALVGFRYEADVSPLTIALCIGGLLLYTSVFGLVTNRQARRIVQDNRTIDAQKLELSEALERQTATAEILRVISSSPTDIQPVFAAVAASAARLCDAFDAAIFRVDTDVLRLVAQEGPIAGYPVGQGPPLDRGTPAGRAVLDRRTIHVADAQAEIEEYPEGSAIARRFGHRTTLVVPLLRAGEAIGVIAVRRAEVRPFSDRQVELLKTFAD